MESLLTKQETDSVKSYHLLSHTVPRMH